MVIGFSTLECLVNVITQLHRMALFGIFFLPGKILFVINY